MFLLLRVQFFCLLCFASFYCNFFVYAADKFDKTIVENKLKSLDSKIEQIQKYIFNSQGKNNRLYNNELKVNDIVEQIVILRTDQLELRQSLVKLDKDFQDSLRNLQDYVKDLEGKIDLSSYNKKILDVILNDLNSDKVFPVDGNQDFVDSEKLAVEENDYNKIIKLLKERDFKEAKLAIKKFLNAHPNSALNSNVCFFMGDIFYKDSEYINAAVNFYKGYQFDPQGSRSDSNIMMLLKSYYQIGRLNDTCKLYNYIERNHSSLPSLMKRELHSIKNAAKCKLQ